MRGKPSTIRERPHSGAFQDNNMLALQRSTASARS
jgi:hypothetical protein